MSITREGQWVVMVGPEPSPEGHSAITVHVLPLVALDDHVMSSLCGCNPKVTQDTPLDGYVVTHGGMTH